MVEFLECRRGTEPNVGNLRTRLTHAYRTLEINTMNHKFWLRRKLSNSRSVHHGRSLGGR